MEFFREIFFKKECIFSEEEIKAEIAIRVYQRIEEEKKDENYYKETHQQIDIKVLKNFIKHDVIEDKSEYIIVTELKNLIVFFENNSLNIYPLDRKDLQEFQYFKQKINDLDFLSFYKIQVALCKIEKKYEIKCLLFHFLGLKESEIKNLNLISQDNISELFVKLSECPTCSETQDNFLMFLSSFINMDKMVFSDEKIKLFSDKNIDLVKAIDFLNKEFSQAHPDLAVQFMHIERADTFKNIINMINSEKKEVRDNIVNDILQVKKNNQL